MRLGSLLIAVLIICASPVLALDKKGMVLHLSFDEGKGVTAKDTSGEGNDGELQGTIEWIDGEHGKAIYISGDAADNLVLVKNDPTLDITGDMTISVWANIEYVGPDGSNSLITKADTYMIHTSNWSGNGIEQELLLWPFDLWQSPASTPIQVNEWRHVTGVYDGEAVKMYIDGDLMGERARSGATAVTANDLVIGRDSRGCCAARRSALSLDDLVIFNRVLSDKEINEAMQGVSGVSVDPVGSLTATWGNIKIGL